MMPRGLDLPHLNFDVLFVVIQHVEERIDVSSFMKTCKTFHRFAVPHLLDTRRGKIHLSQQNQVSSFCRFMYAEPPDSLRVGHLRQLHMSYSFLEGPVELAYELASIVQRSVNLQELTFKDNSLEELLDAGGKAVMDTLSNLKPHTKLKRFCAGEISNRGMDLLLIIETNSITDLEVSYFPPSLDEPQFSVSPIPMLRNFHSTITHLELTNFDLWEADTIQCPLVRTLKLDISGPPTLSTWILMHAFPNIETLIFVRDIPVGYVSFMMDSIRDDNTIHEAAYETLCHWKKNLRYVQSKPTELYILRLPCHVHELRMEYDMGNCSRHHILQVLEDCTPTVVELSVEDGTNRTGSYFLTSLIDKLSLCHTSHLRLEMNFVGDPSDIKEYLVSLVQIEWIWWIIAHLFIEPCGRGDLKTIGVAISVV